MSSSRRSRWTAAGATRWATCRRSSSRRWPPRCWPAVRRRRPVSGGELADGIEAAHAAAAGGSRPDEAIAATIAGATHVLVVGTGADRIAAREIALKIEEASWVPAAVRDLETFLHGHLPATGPETALLLVLTPTMRPRGARQAGAPGLGGRRGPGHAAGGDPGRRRRGRDPRLADAGRPDRRARVAGPARGRGVLLGTAGPLQLVTLAVAAARGTNPDQIRRDDRATCEPPSSPTIRASDTPAGVSRTATPRRGRSSRGPGE